MIEFVWPQTDGEWWAWSSALFVMLSGVLIFAVPRRWLAFIKLRTATNHPEALAEIRGPMGGGSFGLGLAVLILHPQPLLYLALGCVLFFTAVGRLISILLDGGNTKYNWIALIFEGLLSFFPLAYALGVIV